MITLMLAALALTTVVAVNYNTGESDWSTVCWTGTLQSPINIDNTTEVEDSENYKFLAAMTNSLAETATYTTIDNKFEFANSNGVDFGYVTAYQPGIAGGSATRYNCNSGAIHVPSEHTVEGDSHDLEMQLRCYVTSSSSLPTGYANYLMISFLYDEDDTNTYIQKLIDNKELDWDKIQAGDDGVIADYWTYIGSQTNELCTEDYIWVIATEIGDVSDDQIDYFKNLATGQSNARATKPLNNRVVYLIGDADDFAGVLAIFTIISLLF